MQRFFVVVLLVASLGISPLAAQETYTFQGRSDIHSQVSEQIVREAYAQLGLTVQFKDMPWKRSLIQSNAGQLDGEVQRIAGLTVTFPNLLMIPVPVNVNETVVFTKDADVVLSGLESLRPYTIGLLRGVILHKEWTQEMTRTFANSGEQLLRMLDKGRVDVVLLPRLGGLGLVQQLQLTGIRIVEPALARAPLYHYVHTKHAALVPQLTRVLQAMARAGRITAIRDQAFATLRQ